MFSGRTPFPYQRRIAKKFVDMKDQITNKELQELLKQYPDDAIVCIEYCNIRELEYYEDRNLIVIE